MKSFFFFTLLWIFLPFPYIACAQTEPASITWQHRHEEATKKAAAEHKPNYLKVAGSGWCKSGLMLRHGAWDSLVFKHNARRQELLQELDLVRFRKDLLLAEQTRYDERTDTSAATYFPGAGAGLPGGGAIAEKSRKGLSPVAKGSAVVVAGVGIWVATFAWADEPLQQYTQHHRTFVSDKLSSAIQPLGRPGNLAPFAGAAFAGGLLLKDEKLQKAGLVSLGSMMLSSRMTSILKNEFHRYRPSVTTENHYFDGPIHISRNTSLPSAHTATAFAVATSVASVYGPEYKYVPPVAYGIATLVGLSRINDNAHWATDVMAGAVVGYLSAKGTLYLYDMVSHKWNVRKQRRLLITPQPGRRSAGVSATLIY